MGEVLGFDAYFTFQNEGLRMASHFESNPVQLSRLMENIEEGAIGLPEFQREFRWEEDRIRSLIASIASGFPVGTLMSLESGGEVRFKTRPIQGAPAFGSVAPSSLILDGQQRLTSLYQVLKSGSAVQTADNRKKPIERWFYMDMRVAVDPDGDMEDAVFTVDQSKTKVAFDRTIEWDLSTMELEVEQCCFPLTILYDSAAFNAWQQTFQDTSRPDAAERTNLWLRFQSGVIQEFQLYTIPVIKLGRDTTREAVCRVFEKVNTGGVPLDVFELVTATFAADEYDLRADWKSRQAYFNENPYLAPILKAVENTFFLQAISLVESFGRRASQYERGVERERLPAVTCKRKDILGLNVDDYATSADAVARAFRDAAKFLQELSLFDKRDLPYATQLVPLAAVLAILGSEGESAAARSKLAQWFWCGVFGELYGGAVETRFARDVQDVVAWIRGGVVEPRTITDSTFTASRLMTLRTRNSAAYKGIHALLMSEGCVDFRTRGRIDVQTYTEAAIDIHHIFPQKWCSDAGLPWLEYDSIINKTAISARTNRSIGGRAPSEYLAKLEKEAGLQPSEMDAILETHRINPGLLRSDNFKAFLTDRAARLVEIVEVATQRTVARDLEHLADSDLNDYEADDD